MSLLPRRSKMFVALLVLGVVGASSVQAQTFDLAPPGMSPFTANNVGPARSFIFDANTPFHLNSVGIRMDPLISSFQLHADLYSVTPGTLDRGNLLASSTNQNFTDVGLSFFDVIFSLDIAAGFRYELELFAVPLSTGFDFGKFDMEFYTYQGSPLSSPPNAPYTAGPITVRDGGGQGVGGPSNSVLSHFRINVIQGTVPEPGSLAMLAGILVSGVGLMLRRRRRR